MLGTVPTQNGFIIADQLIGLVGVFAVTVQVHLHCPP